MSVEGRIGCSALLLVPGEDVVAQSSVVPLSDVSADLKQTHEMDINATSPPSIDDFGMPTLTPFHGWVKYSNGKVLGQDVVNNLNTSECGQTQSLPLAERLRFAELRAFDLVHTVTSQNSGLFEQLRYSYNRLGYAATVTVSQE